MPIPRSRPLRLRIAPAEDVQSPLRREPIEPILRGSGVALQELLPLQRGDLAHESVAIGPAFVGVGQVAKGGTQDSARRVRVSLLHLDDVRPLLTKPIPEFDLNYAPSAVDAVIAATRCQPFLVQAVAFELVQYLNEQQRKEAAPADAETAITRALESGGEYFANVWSDAGKEGQAILREIAFRGVAADVRRLKSMTNGSQSLLTSAATAARKWLREHDVLDDSDQFAVPMMARWVRENAG
jgi:hypothetical protein